MDECELCAEGTFRAKDIDMVTSQTCTSCPQYFTTAAPGAVTNASCDIRKYGSTQFSLINASPEQKKKPNTKSFKPLLGLGGIQGQQGMFNEYPTMHYFGDPGHTQSMIFLEISVQIELVHFGLRVFCNI